MHFKNKDAALIDKPRDALKYIAERVGVREHIIRRHYLCMPVLGNNIVGRLRAEKSRIERHPLLFRKRREIIRGVDIQDARVFLYEAQENAVVAADVDHEVIF